MNEQPTFETERLILRPYRLTDADELTEIMQHEDLTRRTRIPDPYTTDMAKKWIEGTESAFFNSESISFAIVLKEEEKLLGTVNLFFKSEPGTAFFGYLVRRDCWSRGYASEAAKKMLEYSFQDLELELIYSRMIADNFASEKVAIKMGMKFLRKLPAEMERKGIVYDAKLYSISKEEYCISLHLEDS